MMTISFAALLVLVGLVAGALGATAIWRLRAVDQKRMDDQDRRIQDLEKRAGMMDEAATRGRKHHTYNDLNTLDSVIGQVVEEELMEEAEYEARKARRQTYLGKLLKLREGPQK
jgi:hypothetical protein